MHTLFRLLLVGLTLSLAVNGTAQGPAKDSPAKDTPAKDTPAKDKGTPKDKTAPKEKEVPYDRQVNINLDHIFVGGFNRNGDLVGLHHYPSAPREMLVDGKKCRVEFSFENKGGPQEVTTAQVRVIDPDTKQVIGRKFSTLFPAGWTKEQVERSIREAYFDAKEEMDIDRDGRWGGKCGAGFRIEGYVNASGKSINTAFPIYKKK